MTREEEIRTRAYEIYQYRLYYFKEDDPAYNWYLAEQEFKRRHRRFHMVGEPEDDSDNLFEQ